MKHKWIAALWVALAFAALRKSSGYEVVQLGSENWEADITPYVAFIQFRLIRL